MKLKLNFLQKIFIDIDEEAKNLYDLYKFFEDEHWNDSELMYHYWCYVADYDGDVLSNRQGKKVEQAILKKFKELLDK